MKRKLTAIEKDFKVGAVYFKSKPNAVKARTQATAVGIPTNLRKTDLGWRLSKSKKSKKTNQYHGW